MNKKETNQHNTKENVVTSRQWIDNSLNYLKNREDEVLSELSSMARFIEKLMTVVDNIAVWWLDWRLVRLQDSLKLYERINNKLHL